MGWFAEINADVKPLSGKKLNGVRGVAGLMQILSAEWGEVGWDFLIYCFVESWGGGFDSKSDRLTQPAFNFSPFM